jgi:hypothetical protein
LLNASTAAFQAIRDDLGVDVHCDLRC